MLPFGVGEKILLALSFGYILYRFAGPNVAWSAVITAVIFQIYIWYRATSVWKRLGVPYAQPLLLLGNAVEYTRKGMHYCDLEYYKKFGKIYGTYLFTQAELVISDQELLKKILVKDFSNFTNRRVLLMNKKSLFNRMVTALQDEDWKNTRSTITPAFTSGKLKGTVHLMENCINTLCSILDDQKDFENGMDVKKLMGNMTMDVIANAAFAMEIDAQRNPDNDFSKHARVLASISFKDWRIMLIVIFPWITTMLDELFNFRVLLPGVEEFYIDNLTEVINSRRQNPNVDNRDFLQLLINEADNGKLDYADKESNDSLKKWTLSDRDIIAQAWIFLFAGHETSANTLAFASYLLAWHPEIQEKCFEELNSMAAPDEPITYTHIQRGMPYLEAVISETLRMFPPATRFDRMCQEDYPLTDQLTIPKGTPVVVPVYAIHHDPENYEDPEKFDPERFLLADKKSANPFAYLPFGYGPRNCIGMRFALLEIKMALGNVIRKYKIEPCAKTERMPPQLDVTGLLKTKNPIRLNFKRRD